MSEQIRFANRMSDSDALVWNIEKDPMLRSTITSVALFDRPLDPDRLHARFEYVSRVIPRLRQRVAHNPLSIAPPRWEVDPHFDLRYHLRSARAGGTGSVRDVLRLAEPVAMQGFDRARPLWELTVVDGLDGDRSALIMKLHHSITDGVGGVKLLMELYDLERDAPDKALPEPPEPQVLTPAQRVVDAIRHEQRRGLGIAKRLATSGLRSALAAVADPAGTAHAAVELAGSTARLLTPVGAPLSPVMSGRSLSMQFDTISVPLVDAKKAARAVGGRLNDAFVGGVALGLRRYHRLHGADTSHVRMTMPVNTRDTDSEDLAGNAFAPARFPVPIDRDDPLEAMAAVNRACGAARHEPALAMVEPLAGILNRLPTSVVTQIFGSMLKGMDLTTSNVPGAPFPVYLAGAELTAQYAFGPLTGGATNITLLSYQDDCNIGVNVDPRAIPDRAEFVDCLRWGFDEVLDVR